MVDIPDNNTTTANISVGGSFSDQLEVAGDHDWIRLVLAPGEVVTISLTGTAGALGALEDPYLRLRDSAGQVVAFNDDINFPSNPNSELTYSSATGGTFYIDAGAYNDLHDGNYTVQVTTPPPAVLADSIDSGLTVPDNSITVYFAPAGWSQLEPDGSNIVSEGFTAYEIQQFNLAFDVIEAYTNLTFTVVNDPNADFRLVLDTNQLDPADALAYFYFPVGGAIAGLGVFSGVPWRAVDSIFDPDTDPDGNPDQLLRGGDGFATVVHELLHGLGLAHPHDDGGGTDILTGVTGPFNSYGLFDLNQNVVTMMSYNRGWALGQPGSGVTDTYGGAGGPMALDIAVLQQYYGAPAANTGNTVYTLPDTNATGTYWTAIWDTGGTDELRYNGSRATTIDLRAATIDYSAGGGGFISSASGIAGGFTIAQGVVIENATGGSGADTITGNSAANVLRGNGGNDTLDGGVGIDQMFGGSGDDTFYVDTYLDAIYESVGEGAFDQVYASATYALTPGAQVERLGTTSQTGTSNITLIGNEFGQQILGNNGNNVLAGGGGIDSFIGYGGDDIYVVDFASEAITEVAGQGTDAVYTTVTYSLAAGLSIERLVAAPLASTNGVNLTGNEIGQVIVGNNGVNTINGAGGNDSIYGMGGNDFIEGAQGNDSLFGGTGVDRFIFRESLGTGSGVDRIYDMTSVDNIVFDVASVSALTSLTANQFRLGTAAGDADDRVIYDAATGNFWYDADGTGAQAAILFGVINGAPSGVDHTWFELM